MSFDGSGVSSESVHPTVKGGFPVQIGRVGYLFVWLALLVLAGCSPVSSAQMQAEPSQSVAAASAEESQIEEGQSEESQVEESQDEQAGTATLPAVQPATPPLPGSGSYLLLNQHWIEGLADPGFDLEDPDEVLWHVFSRLPDEVTIYPSENYYYFILYVDGRQIWGNIRLPAGRRDRGVLSLGYFEFDEFASGVTPRISRSKFFTDADGVLVDAVDRFTYDVRYNRKTVRFHLHQLSQEPPNLFSLGEDELFIQRTFDESGYQFFLLFNTRANYFFWVLNEEEVVPDVFDPVEDDLVVGRRSGFAFWLDAAHDGRKILAAVRQISVTRNDYYDGPFDQLADNYADETNVAEYMQRAYPALRGRIDKYGYYTDQERPLRVAISTYFTYYTQADLREIAARVRASDDPYHMISRRGFPLDVESPPDVADEATHETTEPAADPAAGDAEGDEESTESPAD